MRSLARKSKTIDPKQRVRSRGPTHRNCRLRFDTGFRPARRIGVDRVPQVDYRPPAKIMFGELSIVAVTVVLMEGVAAGVHRFVMHGFGWNWHRSHHEKRVGFFERNDLYAVFFATVSVLLFWLGSRLPPLWWVGVGMAAYGILYSLLHDGLVHRRMPMLRTPRKGYLKRLVQAHRLHHATSERRGAVSFGFLYAPPIAQLIEDLRSNRTDA